MVGSGGLKKKAAALSPVSHVVGAPPAFGLRSSCPKFGLLGHKVVILIRINHGARPMQGKYKRKQ